MTLAMRVSCLLVKRGEICWKAANWKT
jgi:hypothetical protein